MRQNLLHVEGKRAVLLTILNNGDASTLDVMNRVTAALPSTNISGAVPRLDLGAQEWPTIVRSSRTSHRTAHMLRRSTAAVAHEAGAAQAGVRR